MPYRASRRTRIYDANYNKGHSLYKSALDGIDSKYSVGRTIRESSLPKPRIDFGVDHGDGSLTEARQRAHRAITEETVFDSRGFKVPKVGIPITGEIEKEFDAEIQSSIDRLRSNRRKVMAADVDLDVPKSSFVRKAKAEFNDSLYNLTNQASSLSESSNVIKKRALKVSFSQPDEIVASSAVDSAIDSNHLTKWTKASAIDDSQTLARQRANESKLRLQELEDDMATRQERQVARERRAANLRRIINEDFNMNGVEQELQAIAY